MSKTVFILGAGASCDAGAPLMKDFLDVSERIRPSIQDEKTKSDFDLVFDGIAQLSAVCAKAYIKNMDNIESVFATFEMGKLLGRLGNMSTADVEKLPDAMRRVIVHTLEESILFPLKAECPTPTTLYQSFAKLVTKLYSERRDEVAVMTFNYDICLDYALEFCGRKINYCLTDTCEVGIPVLKLHGSLNWGFCPDCGGITALSIREFLAKGRWRGQMETEASVPLYLASTIQRNVICNCNRRQVSAPLIVPPTWAKTQYHRQVETVWRSAAKSLSDAENIVILGYSLPPTDEFFRYLYALGTVSDTRLKKVWVFDPDAKVEAKFRELLGPTASGRFMFYNMNFDEALRKVLYS